MSQEDLNQLADESKDPVRSLADRQASRLPCPAPYGRQPELAADLRKDPVWKCLFNEDGSLNEQKLRDNLIDYEALLDGCKDIINEFADGMTGGYKAYTTAAVRTQIIEHIEAVCDDAIDDHNAMMRDD